MSIGELTVSIIGDMSKLSRVFSQASSEVGKFGNSVSSMGSSLTSKVGGTLATVGKAALVTGAALGTGLAYETYKSVTAFQSFEKAVSNAASVTGLTGKAFNDAKANISAVAQELGQKTTFSSSQAADALYNLASAGYDVSTMTSSQLVPMLNLAAGTQYDLAATTATMGATLSQFGLGFESAGRVADVFASAAGKTQANMEKLSYSMNYVGTISHTLGYSIEETTAALGELYNAGMGGEQAGTGLRSVLSDLVNPTEAAAAALAEMGVKVEDVNPATHKLTEIVQLLTDKGLDSAEAFKIFGQVGAPAILALTSKSGELKTLTDELGNAGGAAQTMADQQLDTLAGSMDALSGSVENLMINVGQALAPTIRLIADSLNAQIPAIQEWIVGFVNSFVDLVDRLKPSVNSIITIGETIFDAFSGIFLTLSGKGSGVSGVADIINSIFNRIAGIVLEVTPIIQNGVISIITIFKSIVSGLQPVWNTIKSIFDSGSKIFTDFVNKLGPTWDNLGLIFDAGKRILSSAVKSIGETFSSLTGSVGGTSAITSFSDKIANALNKITETIANFSMSLAENGSIEDAIEQTFNIQIPDFDIKLPDVGKTWDGLKDAFKTGEDIISGFVDDLAPSFENMSSSFESIKKIIDDVCPSFDGLFSSIGGPDASTAVSVGEALAAVINTLTGALASVLKFAADHPTITKFVATVAALATGLAGLSVVAGVISAGITALGVTIGTILAGIIGSITGFAGAVGAGLALITSPFALVIGAVALLYLAWTQNWFGIRDKAAEVWNWLKTEVSNLVTNLQERYTNLTSRTDTLKTQFSNAWQSLSTLYNSIKTAIVTTATNLYNDLQNRYTQIKTACQSLYTDWQNKWNNILTYLSTTANNIKTTLQNWYSDLVTKFNNVKTALLNLYNEWNKKLQDIVTAVTTKKTEILNQIQLIINGIWDKGKQFYNSAASLMTNFKKGIDDKIQGVKSAITELTSWIDRNMPHSPAKEGPLSRLPNFAGYITTPLQSAVKTATSTAKSAGSSIISSISSGIKSAASTVYNAASSALSKVSKLFPHSPAEEGPFKTLPKWDAILIDPLKSTISRMGSVTSGLTKNLQNLRDPLDNLVIDPTASVRGGLNNISNIVNNSSSSSSNVTNNNYMTVGPNYPTNNIDLQKMYIEFEKYMKLQVMKGGYF